METERIPDSVGIIPILPDGKILLRRRTLLTTKERGKLELTQHPNNNEGNPAEAVQRNLKENFGMDTSLENIVRFMSFENAGTLISFYYAFIHKPFNELDIPIRELFHFPRPISGAEILRLLIQKKIAARDTQVLNAFLLSR